MDGRIDVSVLWLRAGLVGVLAFVLGVVGHVSADGLLPGPAFLVALLIGSVLISAPLLNRRASPLRLVAMLVGGQTSIHLALTVTAGHAGDPRTPHPAATPTLGILPSVDGHRVGSLQDVYQGMAGQPTTVAPALPIGHLANDLSAHAPMMAAHLVAAAAVGLWLAHGERCLWTILALTGRRLVAVAWAFAVPVVPPAPRLSTTADRTPVRPRSLWFVRPHSRRGPPDLLAV
jgi:hypothetical protein